MSSPTFALPNLAANHSQGYTCSVEREDLIRFANRDRRPVEALRAAHWTSKHHVAGAAAALELADRLRVYARSLQPDWPSERERDDDLGSHSRVAEALSRVGTVPDR